MRIITATMVVLALVACTRTHAATAKDDKTRPSASEPKADEPALLGKKAPDFAGLIGVDDQKHALKDFSKAKAVVVVFTCNHCPVAQAYEERLVRLNDDYRGKGVQFVAINVNNFEPDKLPKMKERAQKRGFKFPYLYDSSQKAGRDYEARVTPHVFLLDRERRVAYIGAIDDNMNDSKVTERYLRDALDAVLAGGKPKTRYVKPEGCSIKYESPGKAKEA